MINLRHNFFTKGLRFLPVLFFVLGLSACSSPTDKANSFLEEGLQLLDKGELAKANIQFRNALQLNRTLTQAIWGQVQVAERQGNWQGVYNLLNTVLANDPNHFEAQAKLARLFLMAGKLDKALELSDKSLVLNDKDNNVLTLRAGILLKLGNTKGAIEYANRVLADDPEYVDALIVLATERLAAGDAAKAIEYMDRGLSKNKKHIALQLIKIQALDKLSQLDKAEEIFQKLITYYPETSAFNYALAQFYLHHSRNDEAENEYRAVITKNPKDYKPKLKLVGFLNTTKTVSEGRKQLESFTKQEADNYDLKFALVNLYIVQNDYPAADALLGEIISKSPETDNEIKAKGIRAGTMLAQGKSSDARTLISEILGLDKRNEQGLILKARMSIDNQKYDDAIGEIRTVLRDSPYSSRALLLLAQTHMLSGSPELADEQYLRAFKVSRLAAPYGIQYAQFLLKRRQPDRAEGILQDVLSVSPNNLAVLKLLAKTRLTLGDWVGAQQVADQIKTIGDKDNLSDQIRGLILLGKKDYAESISLMRQTYDGAPGNIRPIVALVRTYLLAGKPKEAGDFLDAVLNANPGNIDVRVLRAQVYLSEGNIEKARMIYSNIIEIAPNNPGGYYFLAIIQIREKNIDSAEATLKKGLLVAPSNFALRLTHANLLQQQGNFEDAIKVYEALVADRADSDIVANNLATLLTENRTDKASLDKAYSLSQRFKRSDVPQFKDTFGWASYKVGKYTDAGSLLESISGQLTGIPEYHYHLGMNHLARENKKLAREELERALQFSADTSFSKIDEIRNALENL